jgi:N utilization substance protein B
LGSRRSARIIALQALYQMDISGSPPEQVLSFSWLEKEHDRSTLDFAAALISGTYENLSHIDGTIVKQLEHWDLDRLSYVDRAILRFSTYSILYQDDVPDTVVINEAVDLAKQFGTDDSYRFVNGVLDGIRKDKTSGKGP